MKLLMLSLTSRNRKVITELWGFCQVILGATVEGEEGKHYLLLLL